jgi:hypothetical protein
MSKKYKTSEAIAMLEKNQKLRFVVSDDPLASGHKFLTVGASKRLECTTTKFSLNNEVFLDTEWELVQQPVSFMDAVKAYSEGKTIRCEFIGYNGKKYTTIYDDKKENSKYNQLVDNNSDVVSDPVCCEEILNGTWYVEE